MNSITLEQASGGFDTVHTLVLIYSTHLNSIQDAWDAWTNFSDFNYFHISWNGSFFSVVNPRKGSGFHHCNFDMLVFKVMNCICQHRFNQNRAASSAINWAVFPVKCNPQIGSRVAFFFNVGHILSYLKLIKIIVIVWGGYFLQLTFSPEMLIMVTLWKALRSLTVIFAIMLALKIMNYIYQHRSNQRKA